jgi:hypothetical protein
MLFNVSHLRTQGCADISSSSNTIPLPRASLQARDSEIKTYRWSLRRMRYAGLERGAARNQYQNSIDGWVISTEQSPVYCNLPDAKRSIQLTNRRSPLIS